MIKTLSSWKEGVFLCRYVIMKRYMIKQIMRYGVSSMERRYEKHRSLEYGYMNWDILSLWLIDKWYTGRYMKNLGKLD